jgi:hypothetical protein
MSLATFRKNMLNQEVPGYGLTQSNNPWAKPPKYVRVEDALQNAIQGLENPENRDRMKAFIMGGIPVSTMAKTISFTGFSENMYNPDVAELMIPALEVYLAGMVVEDGYIGPFRMYPEPPEQKAMEEVELENTVLKLAREFNPRFAKLVEQSQEEEFDREMKEQEEAILAMQKNNKKSSTGFISRPTKGDV